MSEAPPRNEYSPTPLGESLIDTHRAVRDRAGEAHVAEILDNRETYDRAH
ncbi:hypothetical protein [Embleya sp. NPDC005575]